MRLADITADISTAKTNIRHLESHMDNAGRGLVRLEVDVSDVKHLKSITDQLLKIKGVRSVKRQRSR